jgi:hypothetical protein
MKINLIKRASAVVLLFAMPFAVIAKDNADTTTSFLSIGASYATNNAVLGSVNSFTPEPQFALSAAYFGKKGLNVSIVGSKVGNSDSTGSAYTSELDLNVNYAYPFLKYFTLTPSYSHYFYSKNSESYKSAVKGLVQLSLTGTVKWFSSSLTAGLTPGDKSGRTLNSLTSFNLMFDNLLGQGNTLSISPGFGVYFNNINIESRLNAEMYPRLYAFSQKHPSMTVDRFLKLIALRRVFSDSLNLRPRTILYLEKKKGDILLSDLFKSKNKFELTSLELSVPITYYIRSFSFYVTPTLCQQMDDTTSKSMPLNWYISLGLNWNFDLGKKSGK